MFLLCGAVGLLASYTFIKYIYSQIKADWFEQIQKRFQARTTNKTVNKKGNQDEYKQSKL